MTPTEIIAQVQARTKMPSTTKIGNELKAAYRWAMRKVFNTENGPDLLVTIGEEHTMSSRTRTYDLAANTTKPFLGIKQLWLKLSTDSMFSPMVSTDSNTIDFMVRDAETASDTSVVARGHPVFYDSINFGEVRFAPALPSGAVIRIDYFQFALELDIDEASESPADSTDDVEVQSILDTIVDAIMDKTTSNVFNLLSDDREIKWEMSAKETLTDAIWTLQRRVQGNGPITTRPWGGKGRARRII